MSLPHTHKKKGFVLLAVAAGLVALIGAAGLAVDVGRMYVVKSEAQTYADAASLAATMELDGTIDGLTRARQQAARDMNTWNFNTQRFSSYAISFAKDAAGPWEEYPQSAAGYRYSRVTTSAPLALTFMSLFYKGEGQAVPGAFISLGAAVNIKGDSAGGQEPATRFREGLFPFSPYAHSTEAPHFGLVPGQSYTLRWAANPMLNLNVCPGDQVPEIITLAEAGGGEERGYIEESSADIIRAAIEEDYQTVYRGIGESVDMTGGAKQTELSAMINRVNQDSDSSAETYADYVSRGFGNGRRVVGAPINTGYPDYRIVQIGAFFLYPAGSYDNSGNRPFCAEYLGAWVQGSQHKGVEPSGAFVTRLVQ